MTGNVLNPPVEAAACRRMIEVAEVRRQILDNTLKTRVLEREEYLRTIAARMEMDRVIQEMHGIYNKEFHV